MHRNWTSLDRIAAAARACGPGYTAGLSRVLSSGLELIRYWLPQVRTSRYAGLDTLCPSGPVMPFSNVSFCRYAAGMHNKSVRVQSEGAVPLCIAGWH